MLSVDLPSEEYPAYPATMMRLDSKKVALACSRCKKLGIDIAEWLILAGKMVIPLTVAIYYAWVRKKHLMVRYLIAAGALGSRFAHALPAFLSFIASHLATPTASIKASALFFPKTKIDPILRPLRNKLRSVSAPVLSSAAESTEKQRQNLPPEKCVECLVLHDPGPQETIADVIFIHGLHGSLYNTWRQGQWKSKRGGGGEDGNARRGSIIERTLGAVASGEKGKVFKLYPRPHAICKQSLRPSSTFTGTFWKASFDPYVSPSDEAEGENGGGDSQTGIEGVDGSERPSKDNNNEEEEDEDDDEGGVKMKLDEKLKSGGEIEKWTPESSSKGQEEETEDHGQGGYSECWPRDWLPKDCPGTRVIALNYSTDPFLWRPIWIAKKNRTTIVERSQEMMDHLKSIGVGSRPIIWVGHSKGGLFVKQMLVKAWESEDESLAGFYRQTKGIMFYSVPHRGSFLASLNLPLLRQSVELTEVIKDSPHVLDLHQRFLRLFEDVLSGVQVLSFTETDLTLMSIFFMRIVSVASADPNVGDFYGVSLDHREICKPRSRKCFLYRELANLINSVV